MFANGYHPDPNAKEPILDFFGVSVKAEDVPQQVERMYLLKKKVGDYSAAVTPTLLGYVACGVQSQ